MPSVPKQWVVWSVGWNRNVLRVVRSLGRGGSACHKYHAKCFDDLTIRVKSVPSKHCE